MSLFRQLPIATKVMAMLLMLGVVGLITAIASSTTLRKVDNEYSNLVDAQLPATVHLVRINRFASEFVLIGFRTLAEGSDARSLAEARRKLAEANRVAVKSLDEAAAMDSTLAEDAPVIRAGLDAIHRDVTKALQLSAGGNVAAARSLLGEADKRLQNYGKASVDRNSSRIRSASLQSAALSATIERSGYTNLVGSGAAVLLSLAAAWLVVRKTITQPLGKLETTMRELADGRTALTIPETDRRDEIGTMAKTVVVFRDAAISQAQAAEAKARADADQQMVVEVVGRHLHDLAQGDLSWTVDRAFPTGYETLRSNLNQAVSSLRGLIAAVGNSAVHIRTGSTEIAEASEDLARRTESNAASLEQTSAAITAMDGRLQATAASANQTVVRANQAIRTVVGGRTTADEAVKAMDRVEHSAKGIDDVIEGLDKIAFQTRVLAMNAAVEAGRAGEAGRGFAVVADLVSALAMRAEEESHRAREQLTLTRKDITTAVAAVGEVDTALVAISTDVGEVHKLLAAIAQDNQAQAATVGEVTAAVQSMDRTTQQNAAMVEETSAAARNLSSEVAALVAQADQFRVDAGGSARPAVAAHQPRPVARPARRLAVVNGGGAEDAAWSDF